MPSPAPGRNGQPITTAHHAVGKFLRTSRLDEIPQMWCVLKGDMAFVGPRPERPEFIEMLQEEIPFTLYGTWCGPGYGWRNQVQVRQHGRGCA